MRPDSAEDAAEAAPPVRNGRPRRGGIATAFLRLLLKLTGHGFSHVALRALSSTVVFVPFRHTFSPARLPGLRV
jgi:hypothetical protein